MADSINLDPTAKQRKSDHINLAFESVVGKSENDRRFFYEPLFKKHPDQEANMPITFLGKPMKYPIWVSSMTGGTQAAKTINHNLARACAEFGLGMGLGSCRSLLDSRERLEDFNVRPIIGNDNLLFANLGIAQIQEILDKKESIKIDYLLDMLSADGLIIHVNPLQEWLQPEGDRFSKSSLHTINELLGQTTFPIVVKEVGQGFGPDSLKALMKLPLAAIEFAALGGTNFSMLEMLRGEKGKRESYEKLARIGHGAEEMVSWVNMIGDELGEELMCHQYIISGGVKDFLDGFYLTNKLKYSAIYGQASGFLKHARGEYKELKEYITMQVEGLKLANAFLRIRS